VRWTLSHRADTLALPLADRHYNRQKIGSPQFVPPGKCIVLRTQTALWVTSWPFAEYVKHAWPGAWVNSCFRNERREDRSSDLVREALAATCSLWDAPQIYCSYCDVLIAMVTFIDTEHVRKKPDKDYGKCYQKAGFELCRGKTKGGLVVVHIRPSKLPPAEEPLGAQLVLA
jgi:hypothetical protein